MARILRRSTHLPPGCSYSRTILTLAFLLLTSFALHLLFSLENLIFCPSLSLPYSPPSALQCRPLLQGAPASSTPRVSIENQKKFAVGGYGRIAKGSGSICATGPILNLLSQRQHAHNIYGSVGELGVHHGRFTGFLFMTARSTEPLVVADLFEKHQDQNVDLSGLGDLPHFLLGLKTYGLSKQDLHTIFQGSTDTIPLDWSQQADFAPFRLISVDASHTAKFTLNDLELAFCNLLQGGIIVLDDWFHSAWPGVVEGYYQFSQKNRVFPFLICETKLFLTNDEKFHDMYYQALLQDPQLGDLLFEPYAIRKERGVVSYESNGVKYLKCRSRQNMTIPHLQALWAERAH